MWKEAHRYCSRFGCFASCIQKVLCRKERCQRRAGECFALTGIGVRVVLIDQCRSLRIIRQEAFRNGFGLGDRGRMVIASDIRNFGCPRRTVYTAAIKTNNHDGAHRKRIERCFKPELCRRLRWRKRGTILSGQLPLAKALSFIHI